MKSTNLINKLHKERDRIIGRATFLNNTNPNLNVWDCVVIAGGEHCVNCFSEGELNKALKELSPPDEWERQINKFDTQRRVYEQPNNM
jgi:hypothetical protein